jgi:hypothetical protein
MDWWRTSWRAVIADQLRERWIANTLEFFTIRAPTISDAWHPRVAKEFVAALSGADWELIVGLNAVAAPGSTAVLDALPRLIQRELVAEWSRRDVVTTGRVRGKIDVPRTVVARARTGSSTAHVYRKLERAWNTDENRALAGFLAHAERTARMGLKTLRTRAAWQATIARNVRQLRISLATPPMRFVEPDPAWAVHALRPLTRRRSLLYSSVRGIAQAWADTRAAGSGESLRKALGGWLVPATDDALFETYVASAALEALHGARTWDSFELSPLGFRNRLAEARSVNLRATLSFDASPGRALGRAVPGDYQWIFRTYDGIDLAARRPDVTLHVKGRREITVLLEAKATDANSQYGRDSIYKCLGYLKDFHQIWQDQEPRLVLIFASGVQSTHPLSVRMDRDLLLTSDATLRRDLSAVVTRALALAEV